MSKNDGGPAFPITGWQSQASDNTGMTLRDWFAGQALAGELPFNLHDTKNLNAKWCYEMADAMIIAREK